MYEFLYAPSLVAYGIRARDANGMPVDVERGYRFALGDNGQVIGPYTHIRRLDKTGNIDYDPVTPLLEIIGEKQEVVGKSSIELIVAEVKLNQHGIEAWTFANRSQWGAWGFKPPKGWATYTTRGQNISPEPS